MKIGIPKEIKNGEFRVGATPEVVAAFVRGGHQLLVEQGAGVAVGYVDATYAAAGAEIASTPAQVYAADLIIKVKEPQPQEYRLLRKGQLLIGFLHLAAEPELTEHLLKQEVTAIAYESITDRAGHLPILVPMSEIAGRLAVQIGATLLQMNHGGRGILLGGVPGVSRAKVVILGGGVVGTEAAKMAMGLGADVTVMDRDLNRLRYLDTLYASELSTRHAHLESISEVLIGADLVIGAVLIPGKRAPKLISRSMIRSMHAGAVFVDVSIDQGGCSATSRLTTHTAPTFLVDGVVHYCVPNIPASCARTATQALAHAAGDYLLALANKGFPKALVEDPYLCKGLNLYAGKVTHEAVATEYQLPYYPPEALL